MVEVVEEQVAVEGEAVSHDLGRQADVAIDINLKHVVIVDVLEEHDKDNVVEEILVGEEEQDIEVLIFVS